MDMFTKNPITGKEYYHGFHADTVGPVMAMFKEGVFKEEYNGIVEIYPRKAMNSFTFEAALTEISKTHTIVKIFTDWYRAFRKE